MNEECLICKSPLTYLETAHSISHNMNRFSCIRLQENWSMFR